MTISSIDEYIAAQRQQSVIQKTTAMTSVGAYFNDVIAIAGNPGAGVLAGTSTANGVVPTDATAGFPPITDFAGGAKGYLTGVQYGSTVTCRLRIVDLLFKAGAYAYNADQTLSSQPSYSGRIPLVNSVSDYKGTELWIEGVTAFTGNLSIAITYTDQDGNAGATTGTVATGVAPIIGRMVPIPLAAGDCGLQKVESVVATVSTAGTFNVLVVRPLWEGLVGLVGGGDAHDMFKTGMPEVFGSSALLLMVGAFGTSTGLPWVKMEIASK